MSTEVDAGSEREGVRPGHAPRAGSQARRDPADGEPDGLAERPAPALVDMVVRASLRAFFGLADAHADTAADLQLHGISVSS
jgi:hypothetical protein